MTAHDDLLAALEAERFRANPRPDTVARVELVGRVDWPAAFAHEPQPADGPEPASTPQPAGDRDRLRALMPGTAPKEPTR